LACPAAIIGLGIRVPKSAPRLDTFAELLSQGMEPKEAARSMGFKQPRQGYSMLSRLRASLGWQAQ
jgi:hypothetical protein